MFKLESSRKKIHSCFPTQFQNRRYWVKDHLNWGYKLRSCQHASCEGTLATALKAFFAVA
eukprot:m.163509 g.163509  ORF g.163509 m.163509 type:complete len:60 (-) comp31293_c2_seq4:1313-1492(-)